MSEEWRRPSPAGLCGEYRHSRKGPISLGEPGACRSLRKFGATGAVGLLHLAFLGCQILAVTDSNASRSWPGNHYWTKQAEQRAENHRAHGCQQTTALRRLGPQLLDCLSFQAILRIPCQWDLGCPLMPLGSGSGSGSGSLLKTGNLALMSPSSGSRKFILHIGKVEKNKNKTTTTITKYPDRQWIITPHFSL